MRGPLAVAALLLVLGLPWHTTPTARSPRPRVAALLTRPVGGAWKAEDGGRVWSGSFGVGAVWSQGPTEIDEEIAGYGSERLAELAYSVWGWERLNADAYASARPDDIGARLPGADQVASTCALPEPHDCERWWTWARFGRCTVLVQVDTDPGTRGSRPMRAYAGTITHTAEAIVRRARPRC
jgi:hypothetical protein